MTEMKDKMLEIPLDKIIQSNWDVRRFDEDEEALEALARSIKGQGLLNPLTVMKNTDGNYVLVAGRRRLKACKSLGMETVPVFIQSEAQKELDQRAITLIENIHRRELKDIERSYGILAVYEAAGYTKEQALKGTKYLHNLEQRERMLSRDTANDHSLNISKTTFKSQQGFKPDERFIDVCKSIGYKPNFQYQLLQLTRDIKEKTLRKADAAGLSTDKKILLTHSKLRDHPEIQEHLAKQIANKSPSEARAKVYQTIRDLETGALEKDGKSYLIHDSLRDKLNDKVAMQPNQYYLPIMGAFLKIMFPIVGQQLPRGEIEYSDDMIKQAKEHQLNLVKSLGHRELLSLNNNMISLSRAVEQLLNIIDKEFEARENKKEMLKE